MKDMADASRGPSPFPGPLCRLNVGCPAFREIRSYIDFEVRSWELRVGCDDRGFFCGCCEWVAAVAVSRGYLEVYLRNMRRTNQQVICSWVQILQGAVQPERGAALLAVHVRRPGRHMLRKRPSMSSCGCYIYRSVIAGCSRAT